MTPKEKAEELVLRYLRIDNNTKEWFNTYIAKQCALVAVDELIEATEPLSSTYFWEEVKEELLNFKN